MAYFSANQSRFGNKGRPSEPVNARRNEPGLIVKDMTQIVTGKKAVACSCRLTGVADGNAINRGTRLIVVRPAFPPIDCKGCVSRISPLPPRVRQVRDLTFAIDQRSLTGASA